jgi:hypothetical protein
MRRKVRINTPFVKTFFLHAVNQVLYSAFVVALLHLLVAKHNLPDVGGGLRIGAAVAERGTWFLVDLKSDVGWPR